jgi:hypothetical protein
VLIEEQDRLRKLSRTLNRLPQGSLVGSWSCDWEEWKQIYDYLIAPEFYDLSRMDIMMKCIYGLQPPIRPIAYMKDTNDHSYIFKTGTEYYYWLPDMEILTKIDGTFTDENVLRGWALQKSTTELEPDYDGIEEQKELEVAQRVLAKRARAI